MCQCSLVSLSRCVLVYTSLSKYEPDKAEQTIRNVLSRSFPLRVLDNVTRAAVQLYVTGPGRTSPEQIRYAYSEVVYCLNRFL